MGSILLLSCSRVYHVPLNRQPPSHEKMMKHMNTSPRAYYDSSAKLCQRKGDDRLTCTFLKVDLEGVKRKRNMETTTLRQALLNRLGHFPERVSLSPTVDSRIDEGTYTRT